MLTFSTVFKTAAVIIANATAISTITEEDV